MLAQSFLSAADLGITEPQLSALQKTLVLLETEALVHFPEQGFTDLIDSEPKFTSHFNMGRWQAKAECGTVACIGGTAELIGNVSFEEFDPALNEMFQPRGIPRWAWDAITPAQAATALRSYLTCGDAKWHEAVS